MKKTVLACFLFGISTATNAFTGGDLLGQCASFMEIIDGGKTDLKRTLQAGLCGGYVLGVREGFNASTELWYIASQDQGKEPVSGKYWDVPDGVEDENVVKIVVRYLEINPDMQAKPAVLSVINALIQTYPVKKQ